LICFHTKLSYQEDILGVPLSLSRNPRTKLIDKITATMDFLSYEAYFEDRVRTTVWKSRFTHWLPIFLTRDHMERAFPYLCEMMVKLSDGKNGAQFEPRMALEVLPRLMNTMVVSLMSGDLHASESALEGYCGFHRLLLMFAERYPKEIKEQVNELTQRFCSNESNRIKSAIPNLGEFLPLLTLADSISWDQIVLPYLEENFDRNALWIIKKHPYLGRVDEKGDLNRIDMNRIEKSFEATVVSKRLLMFHAFFFRFVARPRGLSVEDVRSNYDLFFGRPSADMREFLQKFCKSVFRKDLSWKDFFEGVGLTMPPLRYLSRWLCKAMLNSKRKGYHGVNYNDIIRK